MPEEVSTTHPYPSGVRPDTPWVNVGMVFEEDLPQTSQAILREVWQTDSKTRQDCIRSVVRFGAEGLTYKQVLDAYDSCLYETYQTKDYGQILPAEFLVGRLKANIDALMVHYPQDLRHSRFATWEGQITQPTDAYYLLKGTMENMPQEQVRVLWLDVRGHVIGQHVAHIGGGSESIFKSVDVLRPAIMGGASSVILAHNHPSGDPSPSEADIRATEDAIDAGNAIGVEVLDHIVIGRPSQDGGEPFISLRDTKDRLWMASGTRRAHGRSRDGDVVYLHGEDRGPGLPKGPLIGEPKRGESEEQSGLDKAIAQARRAATLEHKRGALDAEQRAKARLTQTISELDDQEVRYLATATMLKTPTTYAGATGAGAAWAVASRIANEIAQEELKRRREGMGGVVGRLSDAYRKSETMAEAWRNAGKPAKGPVRQALRSADAAYDRAKQDVIRAGLPLGESMTKAGIPTVKMEDTPAGEASPKQDPGGPPASYSVDDRYDEMPGHDHGHDREYRRLSHRFNDLVALEYEARDKFKDDSLSQPVRTAWEERFVVLRKARNEALDELDAHSDKLTEEATSSGSLAMPHQLTTDDGMPIYTKEVDRSIIKGQPEMWIGIFTDPGMREGSLGNVPLGTSEEEIQKIASQRHRQNQSIMRDAKRLEAEGKMTPNLGPFVPTSAKDVADEDRQPSGSGKLDYQKLEENLDYLERHGIEQWIAKSKKELKDSEEGDWLLVSRTAQDFLEYRADRAEELGYGEEVAEIKRGVDAAKQRHHEEYPKRYGRGGEPPASQEPVDGDDGGGDPDTAVMMGDDDSGGPEDDEGSAGYAPMMRDKPVSDYQWDSEGVVRLKEVVKAMQKAKAGTASFDYHGVMAGLEDDEAVVVKEVIASQDNDAALKALQRMGTRAERRMKQEQAPAQEDTEFMAGDSDSGDIAPPAVSTEYMPSVEDFGIEERPVEESMKALDELDPPEDAKADEAAAIDFFDPMDFEGEQRRGQATLGEDFATNQTLAMGLEVSSSQGKAEPLADAEDLKRQKERQEERDRGQIDMFSGEDAYAPPEDDGEEEDNQEVEAGASEPHGDDEGGQDDQQNDASNERLDRALDKGEAARERGDKEAEQEATEEIVAVLAEQSTKGKRKGKRAEIAPDADVIRTPPREDGEEGTRAAIDPHCDIPEGKRAAREMTATTRRLNGEKKKKRARTPEHLQMKSGKSSRGPATPRGRAPTPGEIRRFMKTKGR